MLIINADDFGHTKMATNNIMVGFSRGSITSASAMVFMSDSSRAADLAIQNGLETGLHINFSQTITGPIENGLFLNHHAQIMRYLKKWKFNFLIYHVGLKNAFEYVFNHQLEEYLRLFKRFPAHFDGHHHMHLCANMLARCLMPRRSVVRRNFTYRRGEKSVFNIVFRSWIDRFIQRSYLTTNFLFSLSERLAWNNLNDVLLSARSLSVELQTHPENETELKWLIGQGAREAISSLQLANFSSIFLSRANGRIPQIKKS